MAGFSLSAAMDGIIRGAESAWESGIKASFANTSEEELSRRAAKVAIHALFWRGVKVPNLLYEKAGLSPDDIDADEFGTEPDEHEFIGLGVRYIAEYVDLVTTAMVPRHSPNRQTFPQFGSFSTPRTVKADDAEGAQTTRGSDASGHAPSAYQAAAQQGRMAAIALGDIHRTCMVMANPDVVTAAQLSEEECAELLWLTAREDPGVAVEMVIAWWSAVNAKGTDPYHLSIPAVAAHLCRRAALPSTAPASRLLPALLIRRDVPGADLVREIGLACSWTEEDALAAARATVKGVVGRGLAEARERAARAAAAFVGAWEDEFPASWALLTWRLCQEDLAAALVLPLPVLTRSSLVSSLTGGLDPRTSADLLRAAMALGSGAQRVRWVGASADSAAGAEEPQRRLPQIADLLSKKKKAGREQGEPPERSQSGAGPAASSVGLVRGGPFVEGMVALTEHSGMDGQRWGEIFQRLGRDDPQATRKMLLIWSQSCGRLLRPRVLVAATLHLGRVLGDALGPSVLGTVLVRGELHGAWDEMRSLEVLLTLAEEGGWAAASKATWAYVALKALMGQDAVDVATWVASAMHERMPMSEADKEAFFEGMDGSGVDPAVAQEVMMRLDSEQGALAQAVASVTVGP